MRGEYSQLTFRFLILINFWSGLYLRFSFRVNNKKKAQVLLNAVKIEVSNNQVETGNKERELCVCVYV